MQVSLNSLGQILSHFIVLLCMKESNHQHLDSTLTYSLSNVVVTFGFSADVGCGGIVPVSGEVAGGCALSGGSPLTEAPLSGPAGDGVVAMI